MKVSFFIDRPVFSIVISILIVIVGIIGLTMLPIDQYPQITPPVVKISASYPGASALTVSQAVATPIEQELNGTPGMLYMESNSSNSGGFSATVTFDISADPDLAAVEIQNRLKLAESRLPAEVVQNGISVEKQAASQLMTLCLTSTDPKFDEIYLSNFATLNVLDLIRRIPGVGRVSNIGSRYYAMQIWVQPDKLANFGLTVVWKEAEEKQLRSLGVSEKDIEKLRVHDWAIFNSDRRYYQRMQETGTYLEEVATDMTQPEIKTVEDFLDNIENQQLYQVLIKVDRLTLQAILLQIQGYSIAEIAAILGMKEDTVYKRLGRLKQKIKKLLG